MSTDTRKKKKTMSTEPEPSQEPLPVDLLLEIVALTDPTTVVRCATTGRTLRCAIVDPAFRRRLAAKDGLHPALLFGVSFREHAKHGDVKSHRVIHTPGPAELRARLDDCGLRDSFKPVASRDSLLILRRRGALPELRACDTLTGHVTTLPPTSVPGAYLHVVLSVGGTAGRSYELLAADKDARFHQTFSSKDGRWSAVREVSVPHRSTGCDSHCSAVIGRTVFWPRRVQDTVHWGHVLALDLDAGEATLMELPRGCLSRMGSVKRDGHLRLAAVRGRLCLLVAESRGIAMWTLTSPVSASASAATWSRQAVISSMEIARQMGLPADHPSTLAAFNFEGFGERSGAIILSRSRARICATEFLRLDLGTEEEAPLVTRLVTHGDGVGRVTHLFLHEIGFDSLLQAMKPF